MFDQQRHDIGISRIANRAQNHLRRGAMKKAQLPEVVVLRHEHKAMLGGMSPNARIVLPAQTKQIDMRRIRKVFDESVDDAEAQILVE